MVVTRVHSLLLCLVGTQNAEFGQVKAKVRDQSSSYPYPPVTPAVAFGSKLTLGR